MRDLVFIGDAHLERDDAHLEAFLAFLRSLGESAERVVFAGDLFNLWIGEPAFEGPHQRAVVEELVRLRRRGVALDYLEGNRDYRVGCGQVCKAFDTVAAEGLALEFGGRRIFAVHGDLANPADRRYRLWRRFSRQPALWALVRLLPAAGRLRLAESLERRMRSTNVAFKREFPEQAVLAYGRSLLADGRDAVVLGHFHVEKTLEIGPPGPTGTVYVLPEWRSSQRHLRVMPSGAIAFVDNS